MFRPQLIRHVQNPLLVSRALFSVSPNEQQQIKTQIRDLEQSKLSITFTVGLSCSTIVSGLVASDFLQKAYLERMVDWPIEFAALSSLIIPCVVCFPMIKTIDSIFSHNDKIDLEIFELAKKL